MVYAIFVASFKLNKKMDHHEYTPIYKRLTDYYSDRIHAQEITPGARIDSINRMMERHQVSRDTAKLVIKKLTERGLVVTVPGKGTFVNVNTEIRKIWGVIIPFFSSNIEQLITELGREAVKAACELKYFLHYNNYEEEINKVKLESVRELSSLKGYSFAALVPE